ncbi:hypothetical protein ACE01N_14040 [Saccharicrinis sp. FJH2]|uniref:hypothetical protein n=1 Tax=Saccharicrinis sp. FJH65 TaxID=3344659 RepID=UPI0035F43DB1
MKKKIYLLNSLCLFSILMFEILISCEYSPLKEYYVSIDKPEEAPDIQIDLNTNVKDSIIFYEGQETDLLISIKTKPGIKLQFAEFFVDDSIISTKYFLDNYTTKVSFDLKDDSVHNFNAIFYTGSGSNSIADITGYEGYGYSTKQYKLIANKKYSPINGTFSLEQNGLHLNWKPYNGTNFKNYSITKGSNDSGIALQENEYLDQDYLGGSWVYTITVTDNNDHKFVWARLNVGFLIPLPEITEINRQLALKWSSSEIELILDGYGLVSDDMSTYGYNPQEEYFIPKDSNHFILNNFLFGSHKRFYFYGVKDNKFSSGPIFNTKRELNITMGLPGPYFRNHYDATSKGVLIYDNEDLKFYSVKDDSVYTIMPMDADIAQSPNAEYIVYPKQSTMDVYQYNSHSFSLIKTIQIKDDIDAYDEDLYFKLSDNGILAFINTAKLYVYDIVNEKLLCSKYLGQLFSVVLMPDGKHLIIYLENAAKVYELNNDTIIKVNEFSNTRNFSQNSFKLMYNEPNNIYFISGNKILIKNILTSNIEKEIELGSAFLNFDIRSNKILTYDEYNKEYKIFSYLTGEQIEVVPTAFEKSTEYTFLCNNRIFRSYYKYYLKN